MTSVFTVSQVNMFVRSTLEENALLKNIMVTGEISNFTDHYRSGHLYFSLKDSKSVIRAVMFASDAARLRFRPSEGMKVIVTGRISVYEPSGAYQIYVRSMQPDGIGALSIAYEQLRNRLDAEGIFSNSRSMPEFPQKIAVITSETGAAVRDIFNILGRRWPVAEVMLFPSLVQGEYAEAQLVESLKKANETDADVIIIGRGGGSMEDLWCFNSEKLAREIHASRIPVISAVGHETDFTICDFAADLRAPTPSAAAELAVPDITEVMAGVRDMLARLNSSLSMKLAYCRQYLDRLSSSVSLMRPESILEPHRITLKEYTDRLNNAGKSKLSDSRQELALLASTLDALSPLRILSRGYSFVSGESGQINSVRKLSSGSVVTIRFSDGEADAEVKDIRENAQDAEEENI